LNVIININVLFIFIYIEKVFRWKKLFNTNVKKGKTTSITTCRLNSEAASVLAC
jgi:hypothetical protein